MTEPEERVVPSNAEDAARFKAMESMESTSDDAAVNNESAEALGKAMQDLSVTKANTAKPAPVASTKVNAADVALIVEEMEVTKARATDALRSCEGNVVEALRIFVYAK
ncbi:uncharacterized protein LAJ45_11591 [Morchella importuna]|uniref:Nascent polypeptide-associated complex subunit alpha-like UBA domain-containing protein n=1 Tax=Morchella conica CCBAS932 TaxID=1392247 RepID=A0A3N4KSV7_9PEZI|nr:uncharacterized protein LAJ45_11591 [Morchella importuna]KAH8144423.1 hypothetical protein LAJ45_11591 [Morchella importuna]RPB11421.1 hypothetical protein P167DRAFT_536842 [Morchella conica CCBAS932]